MSEQTLPIDDKTTQTVFNVINNTSVINQYYYYDTYTHTYYV